MKLAVQKYIKRTLCNLTGNSWTLLTWSKHTTQVLKNVLNRSDPAALSHLISPGHKDYTAENDTGGQSPVILDMFEDIDLHLLPLLSGKAQKDRSLPYCHHFHNPRLEHPMGAGGFSGFLKMAGSPKMDKLWQHTRLWWTRVPCKP